MVVKPEIKEKIIAAANGLVAEGIESPTNECVRDRLGGGSLTHISPVMREWRESRKAGVVAALEMPAGLKKSIETSIGHLWATASKLASGMLGVAQQEFFASIQIAADERDEAIIEVARLEETVIQLQKSLFDRDQALCQLNRELSDGRIQMAKVVSEIATLAIRLEDRDQYINGLKTEIKDSRDSNRALQMDLVELARNVNHKV